MRISVPNGSGVKLISMMKPIIDGTLSAFHSQRAPIPELARIIGNRLGTDGERIQKLLCDNTLSVLGDRAFVRKWRDSVQWNPADDSLVTVGLALENTAGYEPVMISGQLYAVDPA
jgi:hypothetical protein